MYICETSHTARFLSVGDRTGWLGRQDLNLRMACFDVVQGVDLSELVYSPTDAVNHGLYRAHLWAAAHKIVRPAGSPTNPSSPQD